LRREHENHSTPPPLLDDCDTLTRLLLSRGGEVSTAAASL